MSLSVRTRFEVFKRDRFTCAYCGGHPPDVLLECDHIIPQAAGGSDEMENLVTSCRDCNAGKSDRLLDEGTAPAYNQASIEAMQERLEQAKAYMETLTSLQAVNDDMVFRVQEAWALAWGAQLVEDGDGRHHYSFVDGGQFPSRASIKRFLRDLPLDDLIYAVEETAFRKDAGRYWPNDTTCRYFYGICHSLIRARGHVGR
jgi:hypothetical protein